MGVALLGAAAPPAGVVVREAQDGFAAQKAGLGPGDVLVGWELGGSELPDPEATAGTIASPFDLRELELELAGRAELTLLVRRAGRALRLRVPPGGWRLDARPQLDGPALESLEAAAELARAGQVGVAVSRWSELALRLTEEGQHRSATWLLLEAAQASEREGLRESTDEALARALAAATTSGDPLAMLGVHEARAYVLEDRGEWDASTEAYREGLEVRRATAPSSLREGWYLDGMGRVAAKRGDLESAEALLERARAIRHKLAPGSVDLAQTLTGLGITARARGDLEAAERHYRAALAIEERIVPDDLEVSNNLNNLGIVAAQRGDLEAAQKLYQRALAIKERFGDELSGAASLNNLGNLFRDRGDLVSAEDHYRRALAILAELAPESLATARGLNNLAAVFMERGDLSAAEESYRRVLAIYERLAPRGAGVGRVLADLGDLERQRGDLSAAEDYLGRALASHERAAPDSPDTTVARMQLGRVALERGDLDGARDHLLLALDGIRRIAPQSLITADVLHSLGELALASGDLATAELRHQRSLGIRRAIARGGARVAEACQRLAVVQRRADRPDEALDSYRCALDALERQRRMLGGSDEARARFSVRHADSYREALDLLVERGRPAEAFHVLERSRARALLLLMAERDLVFSGDLPEELDRERRIANAEHDRALARLATATGAELVRTREAFEQSRRRQAEVAGRIRVASPRLGALQYPTPLDLEATRAVLDPGTLLLSYAIGDEKSYVFAVGPGAEDLAVIALGTDLETLRPEVIRFRQLLEGGSRLQRRRLEAESQRLAAVLLAPVAERIGRAERVLVLPDGPLHLIPFAALADPAAAGRHRYLVEGRPIHAAASATVFAELKTRRRPPQPTTLVAFGDPDYSAAAGGDTASPAVPRVEAARQRGLGLSALPASRAEIEGLRGLFPGARTHLGRDATEERAKRVGEEASLLHFACHGLADSESPLDSALALTLPDRWRAGRENGLLQAWEVLEQVRIRADLVTLSACRTALGRTASGEGILGLTRAFQYAGARSVLASFWAVDDAATADLMLRFYGHLKRGRSKDEALRAAQIELRRRPSTSHPSYWAAFQLFGDWQ